MAATTRKRLDDLIARAQPATRYLDMCLVLRRITGVFSAPMRRGDRVHAGTVALRVLADATPGEAVPIASVIPRASAALANGTDLTRSGAVVGFLVGEEVVRAGGRWDFLRKGWADDPPQQILIEDLQEAQVEVARWYTRWLARFSERALDPTREGAPDPELDFAALLAIGGRRAGKTHLLTLLVWALAVHLPRHALGETVTWLVSVANTERQELDRLIKATIPESWYSYREWPQHQYTLRHGSTVTNVSADNPETVKRGRADILLLNEGAKMPRAVLDNAIGGTGDTGGLVLIASNPPTRQKGAWIRDIVEQAREDAALGKSYPIKVAHLDHKANAAINEAGRGRAGEILRRLNPKLAAADDEGLVLHIGDALFYEYDRIRHGVTPAPQLGDITRQLTRRLYGREMEYLAGVDFQDKPFIYASFWKAYGAVERPILWAVGEFLLKGSEEEFIEALFAEGFYLATEPNRIVQEVTPHNVLWIGDSSATWQNSKHSKKEPPSFVYFKNAGCHIVPPTKILSQGSKHPANPKHEHSYPQVNRFFKEDRLHISPHVKKLNEACKECLTKQGKYGLIAAGDHAHPVDTLRYVAWYCDPPLVRRARLDDQPVRSYVVGG